MPLLIIIISFTHDQNRSGSIILSVSVSESRVWTRVKSYGSPGSLCGHSAVRVANSMMIFGGEGKEDYKNELWKFNFGKIIFVVVF